MLARIYGEDPMELVRGQIAGASRGWCTAVWPETCKDLGDLDVGDVLHYVLADL